MQECDLIMKGGITFGVVYPHAIVEISRDYRLRDIGGTSAGAIAAVFAAAAEYCRQESGGRENVGFKKIGDLAEELGSGMRTMFQPAPALRALFEIAMAAISEEARSTGAWKPMLKAAARAYKGRIGLAVGSLLIWLALALLLENAAMFLLGSFLAALLVGLSIVTSVASMVFRTLPAHDFGLCPGTRQPGHDESGFTDWIADKIDHIAGNLDGQGTLGDPLTVGQLERHGIGIATMTTDLSSRRPYQLPLRTGIHYFSEREFAGLLPQRVVDYMKRVGGAVEVDDPDVPQDLYRVPFGPDFPVVLVARMSLSFPGLISGIGLYRHDNEAAKLPNGGFPVRRCLFSDGGITSNFPIHFFDSLAPRRPTFGIALGAWEEEMGEDGRLVLPTRGRTSTALPISSITSVSSFASSILNTANWQDTMQSMLPGYAERIVTIGLDESREGGLNLAMDAATICKLTEYGRKAGAALRDAYVYRSEKNGRPTSAFDQHRYNRAVSLLPELESALEGYAVAMRALPVGAPEGTRSGLEVLTDFRTVHYKNSTSWRREVLASFAGKLVEVGSDAKKADEAKPRRSVRSGNVPSVDSVIRLIATADRVPQGEGRR